MYWKAANYEQNAIYTIPHTMDINLYKGKIQTERFKRTLIYFDTDTQYANFWRNALCQATKRHLTDKRLKITSLLRL